MHLIEVSPALRQRQAQTLRDVGDVPVRWHDALDELPPGPVIMLANEFFDALPVHQAEAADGWHERSIEIDSGDELAFGVAREPLAHFARDCCRQLAKRRSAPFSSGAPTTSRLELAARVRDDGAAL